MYAVEAYHDYYPSGGTNDIVGIFNTKAEAQAYLLFISKQVWSSPDVLKITLLEPGINRRNVYADDSPRS